MTVDATVAGIVTANGWAARIQQLRLVPQRHGIGDHVAVYAEVARRLYLPALSPDFAYVHPSAPYDLPRFQAAYNAAKKHTANFAAIDAVGIENAIQRAPASLLVFRTILGLGRDELAHATQLFAHARDLKPVSKSTITSMEDSAVGKAAPPAWMASAKVLAGTVAAIMTRTLFAAAPAGTRLKQDKPDTADSWDSVRHFAEKGVPYATFLHQRHYGGAFRQLLDATSTKRGDLLEDAVEALFESGKLHFFRTGAHNQAVVAERFEVRVTPAPDFVVFDPATDALLAMLECKGANDGGTARDKALRFARLKDESVRLGGVPLFAVLGGIGWARVNDALAPVVRDTDGRVFTLSTLDQMLDVPPFPKLVVQAAPKSGEP